MLRRYWAHHPDVAPALAERFVRGDLIGELRAQEVSDQIEMIAGRSLRPDDLVLEVGAGTAALATALARRAGHVVASDVSVAWLVLARRRIRAAGVDNVTLIASTGDRLPFPTATFDLVVAADVIEHVPDARALVAACHDVIRPGGAVWLSTPNRLSVTPEPHVRVWGVGYLPRPLGKRLVRRVRGVPYDDIHTLSVFGLRRTLAATKGRVRITSPAIAQAVRRGYPPVSRRLIGVYEVLRRVPLVRQLMLLVTPLFHAMVVKNGAGDGS
jgi:SAM-dependent methyltransferase